MTAEEEKDAKAKAWLKRILETFQGPTGYSSERMLRVEEIEKSHLASLFQKNGGYAALMDAFLEFYLQTLEEFCDHPQRPTPYIRTLFLVTFWRFRAAYIIFWKGYYFDAASLLRAIFENVLYFGAVMNRVLPETALFEIPEFSASLPTKKRERLVFDHQRRIAQIVRTNMIGADSGLTEQAQDHLRTIFGLLHSHVHRSESNMVSVLMEGNRGVAIPLLPIVDIEKASIFNNTSVFAAWAITKLLPFISTPKLFSQDWHLRYEVLDESFAQFMASFDKEFARTTEYFIQEKLTFSL